MEGLALDKSRDTTYMRQEGRQSRAEAGRMEAMGWEDEVVLVKLLLFFSVK